MSNRIALFFVTALTAILMAGSISVSAANVFQPCSNSNIQSSTVCHDVNQSGATSQNVFIVIIRDVINVLSYVGGAAAIILIVVNGFKLVIAGGDTKSIEESRKGILYAVIGLIVIALAQTFVAFVLNRLTY